MTRVFGAGFSCVLALSLCGLIACGDDNPPNFADGGDVADAQVNDGSLLPDAMPSADGPVNSEGPVITVLDPTDPQGSLSSDDIVTDSRFTVRCLVEANADPVDSTSVKVTATVGNMSRESSASPTSVADVYKGDIVVTDFPNDILNVRCTASDTATEPRTNSANIDTFLDLGPQVQVFSPIFDTSYATQVSVSVKVTSQPLPGTDPGGVADFDNVQVLLGGVDVSSLVAHDGSGNFTGIIQFNDPLFVPTLDGPQTLIVRAPNLRTTTATVREDGTVFYRRRIGPVHCD